SRFRNRWLEDYMYKRSVMKLSLVAALALASVSVAFAGQTPQPSPHPAAPGAKRVSGIIKGAPTGKTFVIAGRRGTATVDATNAEILVNGKPGTWDAVKPGTLASATGT